MPTFLPSVSIDVGDLNIFAPSIPCLFVYTWYEDGEPQSAILSFWRDDDTYAIQHELLVQGPLSYEEAMAWAESHAEKSDLERIHVKHVRPDRRMRGRKTAKAKVKAPKTKKAKAKKRPAAKRSKTRQTKRRR